MLCFINNGVDITVWYNISEMMHPMIAWIMLYVLQIFLPLQMINTGIDDRVRDFANTTEIQHCYSKYRVEIIQQWNLHSGT